MDAYWDNGTTALYNADAQQIPLPDKSVHCVVTSPPYWGLRSYGHWTMQTLWGDWEHFPESRRYRGESHRFMLRWRAAERGGIFCRHGCCWIGCLGLEPTFALYVEHLVKVFRDVKRVLRDDGTLWLNLGDSYTSGGRKTQVPDNLGRATRSSGFARRAMPETLKPKDLLGQPWHIAFALQHDGAANVQEMRAVERAMNAIEDVYQEQDEPVPDAVQAALNILMSEYAEAKADSWYIRSAIVWHKLNSMPESVTDRPTSAHEMIFLLSKRPVYFFDQEAAREKQSETTIKHFGDNLRNATGTKETKRGGSSRANKSFTAATTAAVLPHGRNMRNVWPMPIQGRHDAHFATFPDELPRRCIQAGTSEHGVCRECGRPWERLVEVSGGTIGNSWHDHKRDMEEGQRAAFSGGLASADMGQGPYQRQTVGWSPACQCDAERVPATVLDPFAGSGTTCHIAQTLGRNSVGLDLSEQYLRIARQRIESVPLPLML